MIEPAPSGRVFAAWAIRAPKSKVMSITRMNAPEWLAIQINMQEAMELAAIPCCPSSSGVTATGEQAEAGFDWKKPKPLASSAVIRPRKDTSFTNMTRRI